MQRYDTIKTQEEGLNNYAVKDFLENNNGEIIKEKTESASEINANVNDFQRELIKQEELIKLSVEKTENDEFSNLKSSCQTTQSSKSNDDFSTFISALKMVNALRKAEGVTGETIKTLNYILDFLITNK